MKPDYLFTAGWRVFFLSAGLWAVISVAIWLMWLLGLIDGDHLGVVPQTWHAHEMIFGYATAAMGGFFLTAVPNWTGAPAARHLFIAAAAAIWLAGRATIWASGLLPAGLVAAVILAEDLFMLRPPGLWAALTVLGAEFLRSRAALTRELSFLMEWLLIAAVMVVLFLAGRLAHAVMFLPQIGFGYATAQVLASILAYPLVVGLSRVALGVHKPGMGEVDARGRRF